MDPFVFVVGCERSGTTLLRAMLDSHPELAIPPESHFLTKVMRKPYNRESFLTMLSEHRRFARWELSIEDVSEALDRSHVADNAAAVRALYSTYARITEKRRWGDKTPEYVRNIQGLSSFLPEARFVHLIRDGRDVTLSWLDIPFGPANVVDAAERWRKDVSPAGGRARRSPTGTSRSDTRTWFGTRPRPFLRSVTSSRSSSTTPCSVTPPESITSSPALSSRGIISA